MITVSLAVFAVAAALFAYRMLLGPTLADRVIGVNGLLVCGMGALVAEAVRTGSGAFLPALVVVTLVGFVGTGMVARYLEGAGTVIGEFLILLGAVFMLLAGVGVFRFHDVFSRMHALGKASTLGLLLVLAGGLVALDHANDVTFLALAGILHVATSPIGNNLLARATYYAEGISHGIADIDELAECRAVAVPDTPEDPSV